MLVNEVDIDQIVADDYKDHESEFNGRYNKTSLFVLPMVDLSVTGNNTMRYLRNAYLDDQGIEHDFECPVFMLFRVKNQKEKYWVEYTKALVNREVYITDYYVGMENGSHLIMFVLQIPQKWRADLELFKKGQYSRMSKPYKNKFDQYAYVASGEKREVRTWGILNKSDALKDEVVKRFIVPTTSIPEDVVNLRRDMDKWDEIWDAPNDKEEILHFTLENINADTNTNVTPFKEQAEPV